METPDKRPWRRYLHLSLRAVLLLVLVLGSWLGWMARGVRVQREAVAAIERAGGWSAHEWEWEDGEKIRNGRPWGPNWLVDLIGIDYFGSVAVVVLPEAGSDAVLAHIGRLGRVQAVNLSMAPVTDAGVAHLQGLAQLRDLSLNGSGVTDAGLALPEQSKANPPPLAVRLLKALPFRA